MKNGVSIAGLSETVHEIRAQPAEAQLIYRVAAHWEAQGQLLAHIGTNTIGTLRAARDFRLFCTPAPRAASAASALDPLTPMEMALIGIGSDLLATVVLGSSTKRQTIVSASVLLSQAEPRADWSVEYELAVHGDMKPEELIVTLETASRRSANHRALVERNELACSLSEAQPQLAGRRDILGGTREVGVSREPWPFAGDRRPQAGKRHLAVRWDYGVQFSAWPDSELARQARFPVDQPKQSYGMDRGPSPQEYLLSGLATSVTETAVALARARGLEVQEVTCRTQGRNDIHGVMGLDPRVPAKLQDITCALGFRGGGSPEQQAELAREAVETAEVARLLTHAQPARIGLFREGEQIHELISRES